MVRRAHRFAVSPEWKMEHRRSAGGNSVSIGSKLAGIGNALCVNGGVLQQKVHHQKSRKASVHLRPPFARQCANIVDVFSKRRRPLQIQTARALLAHPPNSSRRFSLPLDLIEQDAIILALHKGKVVRSAPDELLLVQGYVDALIIYLL